MGVPSREGMYLAKLAIHRLSTNMMGKLDNLREGGGARMPKAYVYTVHGGPEVEAFADLPQPVPDAGQLLVAVRAAGVNPADWKRRAGFRPPSTPPPELPAVLGGEVAGVVEVVGDGVAGFAVGDAVSATRSPEGMRSTPCCPRS